LGSLLQQAWCRSAGIHPRVRWRLQNDASHPEHTGVMHSVAGGCLLAQRTPQAQSCGEDAKPADEDEAMNRVAR
jgi:hypothetical protein